MRIYPAIDLMNGEAVRLKKGKRETKKVYGNPLEFARKFSRFVDVLHIVDLDGAFRGETGNLSVVESILEETDLEVELGGGLRTLEEVKEVDSLGVIYPIIGTKAMDEEFVREAAKITEGLTVSLDVRGTELATGGWKEGSVCSLRETFRTAAKYVDRFIVTVISRDGTLSGPGEVEKFWDEEEVIYAGGVSSREDLVALGNRGFDGAIIGKALYEGEADLENLGEFTGG